MKEIKSFKELKEACNSLLLKMEAVKMDGQSYYEVSGEKEKVEKIFEADHLGYRLGLCEDEGESYYIGLF
jgi:hypothetical protein